NTPAGNQRRKSSFVFKAFFAAATLDAPHSFSLRRSSTSTKCSAVAVTSTSASSPLDIPANSSTKINGAGKGLTSMISVVRRPSPTIRSASGRIAFSGEYAPPLLVKTPAAYGSVSSNAPLPEKVVKTGNLSLLRFLRQGRRVASAPAITTGHF